MSSSVWLTNTTKIFAYDTTMAEQFDEQKPHFVLVPFLAQGHINPLLDMACFIACRSRALVSFITTPVNTARIRPVIDQLEADNVTIRFIELEFPCAQGGLPEGIENLDLIPSPDLLQPFFHTLSLLAGPLELYIREAKPSPSCMIVDRMSKFTAEVARRLDLPRIVFQEPSCFYALCSYNIAVHGDGSAADESSDTIVVPGLPQRIEVSKNQATDWGPVATRETELEETGDGVIFNTFYELEAEFVELYKRAIGKPVWTMGPLALYNKDVAKSAARGKKSAIDEHQVLSWLDSMQPKSVLLASFGSLIPVKPSQLIEVGCGLEASGKPFIWVIKEHDKSPELDKWMSEGFLERTKDRSLVITGFAPQVVILSHPSIGGFLMHCGWDSILETVAAGVPTITWPHLADQFLNEKLIVYVHDIGVSLGVTVPIYNVKEDEVPVKTKDVEKAISRLMDCGEECKARRARAAMLAEKAKKAVEEGGSSCANLEDFLEYITEKSR